MLQIQKRDGSLVSNNPNKILNRIKKASKGLKVNTDEIFIKVITSVPTEGIITTKQLDELIANTAAPYTGTHYDYSKLAAKVSIASYYKSTNPSIYETFLSLNKQGIIDDRLIATIEKYGVENVEKIINEENDDKFNFFAWKALQNTYLLKDSQGKLVERPQYMYLRIALWLTHSFEECKDLYNSLSEQLISYATPIMINSGTTNAQLSSCVLIQNYGDSRQSLLDTLNDVCKYSSDAAGIGLMMSNIRSKKSKISTSGGDAGGLLKYLKIVNEGLRFFNQQGKRPGAAAIYIEPWHKDIFDLLEIKKQTGKDEMRARDIFTALWVPDLFMKVVKEDSDWYLFCPNDIIKAGLRPLYTLFGEEFEKEYYKAVELGLGEKVRAQDVWSKIIESQIETGVPYMAFKDNANRKSNHQMYGTIKQSNLCIEIMEYTDSDTIATCNLASVVLKNYVEGKKFNFELLRTEVHKLVRGLNEVIDINHYSAAKGKKGALEQRAIAIGVQGLADVFFLMDYIFTSEEANELNKNIFETIYYSAIEESCRLAEAGAYPKYDKFEESPMAKGIFQFDMWGVSQESLSGMYDWASLKERVIKYGTCNSLVTAQMPVAGSAKITDSYEMTEPADSNLFNRRVLGGEFLIVNKYLIQDLEKLGIWGEAFKNDIINNDGSIQNIDFLSYLDVEDKNYEKKIKRIEYLLLKYKSVWEIPQKQLIDMAAARGIFIDQSQSMNIYFDKPTVGKISSSHNYAFEKGLKTGCYYLRSKPISTGAKHLAISQKVTVREELVEPLVTFGPDVAAKPTDSPFDCFGCSA